MAHLCSRFLSWQYSTSINDDVNDTVRMIWILPVLTLMAFLLVKIRKAFNYLHQNNNKNVQPEFRMYVF